MNIFDFIQNQIFKMEWLNNLIHSLLVNVFQLDTSNRLVNSIQFFIYDTLKIFILLIVLISFMSYIQSYFPPEKTKAKLEKVKGIKGNILGALFGTLTPFCACSSIPIFITFLKANLSLGITFSFLISSPLVDLASFVILSSFLGFKIALLYVIVGLLLAVIGGFIIDKLHLEKYVESFVYDSQSVSNEIVNFTQKDRLIYAKEQVNFILGKVWKYIFIGVFIGALIHNYIPISYINYILGNQNPFSVLIATLAGIPMYADIFGTIPIAEAMYFKSVPIGTIMSFMIAVTALSIPSLLLLSKVIKKKLLVIYIFIVTVGILMIGYLFNIIL